MGKDDVFDSYKTNSKTKSYRSFVGIQLKDSKESSEADDTACNTVLPLPTRNSIYPNFNSISVPLYTPWQKWEFDNNLPVDGVKDVEKWALEVGVLEEEPRSSNPKKRKRKAAGLEPPKYGTSSDTVVMESISDDTSLSDDTEEKPKETVGAGSSSRKGKEKEDNL